jgi:hypothetical protein
LALANDQMPALHPEIIVGDPEGGKLSSWARLLGTSLGLRLSTDQSVRISHVGATDGVTAANQFDARTSPDGSTALLVSGLAAMAWLAADPRAQFDAGHWLPVATGLSSGLVLLSAAQSRRTNQPADLSPLRVATSGAAPLSIPALLGMSLLGRETRLVSEAQDPLPILRAGTADIALLHGPNAVEQALLGRAEGAVPLFSLGVTDEQGNLIRDPLLPEIPTLIELLPGSARPTPTTAQMAAWRAAASATQVEFALVLPWLTPASAVARWRAALLPISPTSRATSQGDNAPWPRSAGEMRIHVDPSTNFGLSMISTDAPTLLELRRWINAHSTLR